MSVTLHGYWRSSAAYRVRVALNLKAIEWTHAGVSLVRDGGEHRKPDFAARNPQKLVPVLDYHGETLTQSLAIIEYLDEVRPEPALLPREPAARARVRALALAVACEIHPVNNLRVLNYVTGTLGADDEAKRAWYAHWVDEGFEALERMLVDGGQTGAFCHGDTPTLADVCLVPQVYNARRYGVDLSPYPAIRRIDERCLTLPAFADAAPERQPDAA